MKVRELFENDDDHEDLAKFYKHLGNSIKARSEMMKLLAKQHKWDHEVGDMLYSSKTGKTYELTGRTMVQGKKGKDGHRPWEARYLYKTNDGESGSFSEPLMKQHNTLKNLTRPFTKDR